VLKFFTYRPFHENAANKIPGVFDRPLNTGHGRDTTRDTAPCRLKAAAVSGKKVGWGM